MALLSSYAIFCVLVLLLLTLDAQCVQLQFNFFCVQKQTRFGGGAAHIYRVNFKIVSTILVINRRF